MKYNSAEHDSSRTFARLIEDVCERTSATILPIEMLRHKHSGTTRFTGTFTTETSYLSVLVNLVVLQHGELHLLRFVFDFLRGCVILLLPFLTAAAESEHEVERRLLLDVVVAQRAPVFELFTGEDETLLVGRDSLLVLDFGFHVVDGVAGFHFQCYGLPREGFHEDLHCCCLISVTICSLIFFICPH